MNSFTTQLVIAGPFRGAFDTDAIQEALEKDLATRFGAPVAVEVAYQSGVVVASLSIPPGYDLSQLRLMSNSSAWLREFKALMGETVTGVRTTNLPPSTTTTTTIETTAQPSPTAITANKTSVPAPTTTLLPATPARSKIALCAIVAVVAVAVVLAIEAIGLGVWWYRKRQRAFADKVAASDNLRPQKDQNELPISPCEVEEFAQPEVPLPQDSLSAFPVG